MSGSDWRVEQTGLRVANLSDSFKFNTIFNESTHSTLRLGKPNLQSVVANLTEKNNQLEKKICPNTSLGFSKSMSLVVLAKAMGYALCQIYQIVSAGGIKSKNGFVSAEEAERLLHPKIQKI